VIYEALPRWRKPLLIALTIATLAALAMIPRLRAVFAPEELVPAAPDEAARARRVLGPFGEGREPLLVLIAAPDVLSEEALAYQHEIALHLSRARWAERVDGVTITPLPHFDRAERETATLEDLPRDSADPSIEEALGRALATDPRRFPLGLLSLGEGAFAVSPTIEGELDESERLTIEEISRSNAVRGRFVSEDRRLALLAVTLRAIDAERLEAEIAGLRAWISEREAPRGTSAEIAGMPAVRVSMVKTLREEQLKLVLFAILGSVLVLGLGMRSWSGVLLPLASAGMTSALVIGAMAALGEPINLLNNTIAPLLITIGLGDAVHLIARYREELRRGPDRFLAARRTMRAMAGACFLTAATTAIGFGSLVVSETSIVRHYAITAALGVLLGYLVTVSYLPAALVSFPIAPSRERYADARLERWAGAIARFSARHAGIVIIAALLALAGTAWIGKDVRVDSTLSAQLDESSEVRRTFARIEAHLSGVRAMEIGLRGPEIDGAPSLARLARFEHWLRAQEGVLHVDGPSDRVAEIWAALSGQRGERAFLDPQRAAALVSFAERAAPDLFARYLRDGRARIEVHMRDAGERRAALLIGRIERRLAAWDGVDFAVGGEAARSARGLDRLLEDLSGSVGLAMAIIFVLIGTLLRSVRLGIASILPNVLPLSITLAYMSLRDIPLHAATTIVFSVSIGLAVDDTIHILSRYREEIAAGRGRMAAMLRSLRSSGRAALVSAATIWVGYATLALFASFVPIRLFGELSLVALGSALACEILVLPATLAWIGPVPAARKAALGAEIAQK
jgi:uncharacterized protein